jgi:hypothetical protein
VQAATAAATAGCARVRAYDGMRGKLGLRGAWHQRLRDERESCALSIHPRCCVLSSIRARGTRSTHPPRFAQRVVTYLPTYLPTCRRKLARMHSAPLESTESAPYRERICDGASCRSSSIAFAVGQGNFGAMGGIRPSEA